MVHNCKHLTNVQKYKHVVQLNSLILTWTYCMDSTNIYISTSHVYIDLSWWNKFARHRFSKSI